MERTFYVASKFFPAQVKERVSIMLHYCGSTMTEELWLGRAFVISAIVYFMTSLIFLFTVQNFIQSSLLLLVALGFYHLATYLLLYFKAESRGRAVEKVLPSLLQLIAANLNSGMTPFQAFKQSSRKEFGILKEEMDKTIALSLSTISFNEALLQMPNRVKSPMFKNVIDLFVEGMRTGGPLATLLSDIAKDITEDLDLRREIVTRSKSYILFIGFIVVFGSPLLSAVSVHFIRTIAAITGTIQIEVPEVQNIGGITFGQMTLRPEFLISVSMWNIILTSLIASWLLAIIADGKDKYVVKYALIMVPMSIIMYYSFDYLVSYVLSV